MTEQKIKEIYLVTEVNDSHDPRHRVFTSKARALEVAQEIVDEYAPENVIMSSFYPFHAYEDDESWQVIVDSFTVEGDENETV